ncbi:prolyl oligopeptidase family serine peptidase [Terrimonas pollutisoli]|uniref:prolyl oligopeptidase family serine peptidase n=1 Tax=Terrimonas pollutisoli TaxID=3034147 RepID=UPI0034DEA504
MDLLRRSVQGSVHFTIFTDEEHGFVKKENEIKGYGQILQFLDKHLKGQPANPKRD